MPHAKLIHLGDIVQKGQWYTRTAQVAGHVPKTVWHTDRTALEKLDSLLNKPVTYTIEGDKIKIREAKGDGIDFPFDEKPIDLMKYNSLKLELDRELFEFEKAQAKKAEFIGYLQLVQPFYLEVFRMQIAGVTTVTATQNMVDGAEALYNRYNNGESIRGTTGKE